MLFASGASSGDFIRSDTGDSVGATGSVVVSRTGTLSSDFQLAFMGSNNDTGTTWTGDIGWTEDIDQNATPDLRVAHIASSGTSTSWTFTNSGTSSKAKRAIVLTFRGVTYDAIGSIAINSGTTTITTPSMTAASANTLLLMVCFSRGTTAFSTPSGMSPVASGGGVGDTSVWAAFSQRVSSGATGSRSTTCATNPSAAVLVSLSIS
jgi:hypothetical protein